jgi:hypothetical protein
VEGGLFHSFQMILTILLVSFSHIYNFQFFQSQCEGHYQEITVKYQQWTCFHAENNKSFLCGSYEQPSKCFRRVTAGVILLTSVNYQNYCIMLNKFITGKECLIKYHAMKPNNRVNVNLYYAFLVLVLVFALDVDEWSAS